MTGPIKLTGFDREDSRRLGFSVSSVFYGAISLDEFRRWAFDVYVKHVGVPLYMLELSEFPGPLSKIFEVIGFVPECPLSKQAKDALLGIAYLRGHPPVDAPCLEDESIRALEMTPNVRLRFEEEFPFIDISSSRSR